jgi:hypothetical protein
MMLSNRPLAWGGDLRNDAQDIARIVGNWMKVTIKDSTSRST